MIRSENALPDSLEVEVSHHSDGLGAKKGFSMKRVLFILCAFTVVTFSLSIAMAAGEESQMSKNPEAQAFVGTWKGLVENSRGESRELEVTLSNLQDDGSISCNRYHLGTLGKTGDPRGGSVGPKDVEMKKAILERFEGKLRLVLTPASGSNVMYVMESGKLVRAPGSDMKASLSKTK